MVRIIGYFAGVNRWRIWWRAGAGETPSEELVAAAHGLNGRVMRQAGRLVRRGGTADDIALARYAVALARERERRYAVSPSLRVTAVILAVLTLGSAGVALAASGLSRWQAATFGVLLPALFAYVLWRAWQERSNVQDAEQVNREFLRRAGAPYVPGGPPTTAHVPPFAVVGAFALRMTLFIPLAGAFSLTIREASVTPDKVLLVGLPIAFGAAVGIIVSSSQRNSKIGELSTTQSSN